MADFLAEGHEDLLLPQVADAMEYEYVLDQGPVIQSIVSLTSSLSVLRPFITKDIEIFC